MRSGQVVVTFFWKPQAMDRNIGLVSFDLVVGKLEPHLENSSLLLSRGRSGPFIDKVLLSKSNSHGSPQGHIVVISPVFEVFRVTCERTDTVLAEVIGIQL